MKANIKKAYLTALLTGFVLSSSFSFAQTRICIVNECDYSRDTTAFLRLPRIYKDYDGMNLDNVGVLYSGQDGDFKYNNVRLAYYFDSLDKFYFKKKKRMIQKQGIENKQASRTVALCAGERLEKEGYEIQVPDEAELNVLYDKFTRTKDGQKQRERRNEAFRKYLADAYGADILLVLTDCPFSLSTQNLRTGTKKDGLSISGNLNLSCQCNWEIYNSGKNSVTRTFETQGTTQKNWEQMSSEEAGRFFYKKLDTNFVKQVLGTDAESNWDLLPVITDSANSAVLSLKNELRD